MKKEDIQPWDWYRIFFGEAPVIFLLEVFLRTSAIYIALLIIVRLMGKRMGGQLTVSELAIMVTLGAIVSPAMQIPQLGVLMGVMILICALIFQRGINLIEFESAGFEKISQGTAGVLVKDGVIQLHEMSRSKVSKQQLFSALRGEQIFNLGDVDRVYFEACGVFSTYKKKDPVAGLQIYPPSDRSIDIFGLKVVKDYSACAACGIVRYQVNHQPCSNCNKMAWLPATISVKAQKGDS